jgi:uncharacterized protein YbbK (DUF523 family)
LQVLNLQAAVIDSNGGNVTEQFIDGAKKALMLAQQHAIKIAVLKEGSPSCGSASIGDGTFTSSKINEAGVTTALLRANGIAVFNELEFDKAFDFLALIGAANSV